MIDGRENFPFASELFCLFFERFPETRPSFVCRPPRPMTEVWMHMWGEMMPKRGMPDFPARISREALQLLASEADHVFVMVSCPYVGMDWRGCPNILFTWMSHQMIEVRFKLILYFHFIVLLNSNKFYSSMFFNVFY
jgi:hypothetical protein